MGRMSPPNGPKLGARKPTSRPRKPRCNPKSTHTPAPNEPNGGSAALKCFRYEHGSDSHQETGECPQTKPPGPPPRGSDSSLGIGHSLDIGIWALGIRPSGGRKGIRTNFGDEITARVWLLFARRGFSRYGRCQNPGDAVVVNRYSHKKVPDPLSPSIA